MNEFLASPQGTWAVVGGCLVLGILFAVVKNLKVKERKHFSDLAGALTSAGVPEVFTTPISDLAVGDGPGFVGAVVKAAQQLRSTDGWTSLVKGIFSSAMSDPARKAAFSQLLGDLQAGASDATLSTDLSAAYAANPLSKVVGHGPLATDLSNIAARMQTLKNNPLLAHIDAAMKGLPSDIQTHLLAIADAAHAAGAAAVATAPVAPVAPFAPVVAAAGAAVATAMKTVVVPADHTVTVTPPPAAPATAPASAPAAS